MQTHLHTQLTVHVLPCTHSVYSKHQNGTTLVKQSYHYLTTTCQIY